MKLNLREITMNESRLTSKARYVFAATLLVPLLSAPSIQAATVVWQGPVAVSTVGDTIVDTNGTLVEAINFGTTTDSTVNGVVFDGKSSGLNGINSDFSFFSANYANANLYNDGGIGAQFEAMLDATSYLPGLAGQSDDITLKALSVGATYDVQFFFSDDRWEGSVSDHTMQFSSTGSDSGFIDSTLSYSLIGTFTADGLSQTISLQNGGTSANHVLALSGYQLRETLAAPAVVPVPAAVWLFGSGLLGLVGIARRKKA